jgi:DNA-binding GntR family transcriptional regulator
MSKPSLRSGDSSQKIASSLREEILAGNYSPGQRLVQEEIADRFGGSRIPVREALRDLESEGLVTFVANAGARVAQLTVAECVEVYQMRERIEPLLLRYSAEHLTQARLADLNTLAQEMEAVTDPDRFVALDRDFHLSMYEGAETTVLGDLVQTLWNKTQPYRRAYTRSVDPLERRVFHDEHRMLLRALIDGDLDLAENLLAVHVRRTRQQLERHPEVFSTTNQPATESRTDALPRH